MSGTDDLGAAIAARIVQQLDAGATSDTILKLAEAYAWVVAPDNAHGGFSAG
ncbi:MAG: hypothetical protein M0Z33_13070 [Actinomycetota bacterium]|nr:hypothetical protein [Actinomycetota bacterium]